MAAPESILDSLSTEGRELVPVNLRLMAAPDAGEATDGRVAWSAHHRARGYQCYGYHKPISRCLRVQRP